MEETKTKEKRFIAVAVAVLAVALLVVSIPISKTIKSKKSFYTQINGRLTYATDVADFDMYVYEVGAMVRYGRYDWLVLAIRDSSALLITKDCVSDGEYHYYKKGGGAPVTWEQSMLRKWLNKDFYNSFNEIEKKNIQSTAVQNEGSPNYGTSGGNATVDKIFLLSLAEAQIYFNSDSERVATSAGNQGWLPGDDYYWWLRSPGNKQASAVCVDNKGHINSEGLLAGGNILGVRPAMWITL